MDETKLSEWEQLAAGATPGPWKVGEEACVVTGEGDDEWSVCDCDLYDFWWEEKAKPLPVDSNAAFIAAAREAVPELCKEVRRLMALVNLCIDDHQNWTQRAIELELYTGQDVEFYRQSILAENKRLKAQLQVYTAGVHDVVYAPDSEDTPA